jgi:hypothetical protein
MMQEIGHVLGSQATGRIATSAVHPMFVKLFLENDADDGLAEDERRRAVNRSRRTARRQPRVVTRSTARDRDHRPAR